MRRVIGVVPDLEAACDRFGVHACDVCGAPLCAEHVAQHGHAQREIEGAKVLVPVEGGA